MVRTQDDREALVPTPASPFLCDPAAAGLAAAASSRTDDGGKRRQVRKKARKTTTNTKTAKPTLMTSTLRTVGPRSAPRASTAVSTIRSFSSLAISRLSYFDHAVSLRLSKTAET